ncbi:MAG: hypothetical protein KC458_10345 [Dehalococcoidia bacterium]|nr:hypothetical protein [Dehalococcoidia bacterium]MCA9857666.1 hypothetical protein [Dehalococcoidia bacterium]
MKTTKARLLPAAHTRGLLLAAAMLAALGFSVATQAARADDPDNADASLQLHLDGTGDIIETDANSDTTLGIDLGDTGNAGVDLGAVSDGDTTTVHVSLGANEDTDGAVDQAIEPVAEGVDLCVTCDDTIADGHVAGGDILDGSDVDACILGNCSGDSPGLEGAIVTLDGNDETDGLTSNADAEVCVIADCSGDLNAVARIYSATQDDDLLGDNTADVCILGDCDGSGGTDGVVGTIGTTPNILGDESVNGEVCILAYCADGTASHTDTSDDPTEGTGSQSITNTSGPVPGDGGPIDAGSDIPLGDPIGAGEGDTDSSQTSDTPAGDQSGDNQQGLPNTGFAPLTDTPLPLVALLALGAAWATGAYLIRRHG